MKKLKKLGYSSEEIIILFSDKKLAIYDIDTLSKKYKKFLIIFLHWDIQVNKLLK